MNDYDNKRQRGNIRKNRDSNIKRPPNKIDGSKDKHTKFIPKERHLHQDDDDNPLEDMEIIRAMGMDKCKDCNNLYPLHRNRCPICNNG